ncbi:MAG TPA: DUF4230 domain-containing protein [Bryobacteraceae bacterium]|nr:DUF4230 domain-containing protein [Bryobacteraceae bacterium]
MLRLLWAATGAVVGIVLATVFFSVDRRGLPIRTLDAPAMVREIQGLSELVSVKYTVQKVVGLEEKKTPLGAEKLLLIVQAEVLAGVDLSKVSPGSLKILAGDNIKVALPAAEIFHIVIDDKETKVWDRQITWWTPWVSPNPDLERQARLAADASVRQAALDMGILDQAQRNAENVIRNLLQTLGAKSVTVGPT